MIKSYFLALVALLAAACLPSFGQTTVTGPGGHYTPGVVTGTGQLGAAITFQASFAAPSNHTFAWWNAGTSIAPAACTFEVDGSTDGVHWFALTPTNTDCTNAGMIHIAYKPVDFIRVLVNTYTAAATGTTLVTFDYVRGDQ